MILRNAYCPAVTGAACRARLARPVEAHVPRAACYSAALARRFGRSGRHPTGSAVAA
jgi:hypothetical protein